MQETEQAFEAKQAKQNSRSIDTLGPILSVQTVKRLRTEEP